VSISTRKIKPSDCILAFGIPTSEGAFRADRARNDKDFAGLFSSWARYDNEFVDHLTTIEPMFRGLGVRVVHQLSLSRFGELLNTAEVFILFSHWLDNRIELSDGLRDVIDVVNAVPSNYEKILDLCVCRSEPLVGALRAGRPKCLIRYVAEQSVIPRYWLFFFLVVFKYLNSRQASYLEAVEVAVREFLAGGNRNK
jgi:hypothetical protein